MRPDESMTKAQLAEARGEILALLAEFTYRVDAGISVEELFDQSAVFATPRGPTQGPAAIAKLFASIHAARKAEGHISRHGNMNVRIVAIDENHFEVRHLMLAMALPQPHASLGALLVGDQTDVVVRDTSAIYRFLKRTLTPMLEFSLTPKMESRP
jgi:hypothetical protein